jgi:Homocysteine S-methyltransferase
MGTPGHTNGQIHMAIYLLISEIFCVLQTPLAFIIVKDYNTYRAAAKLAKEVAAEGGALTLGGVSQCPSYLSGKSKEEVQAEFRKQVKVFVEEDLDFLLCEVIFRFHLF